MGDGNSVERSAIMACGEFGITALASASACSAVSVMKQLRSRCASSALSASLTSSSQDTLRARRAAAASRIVLMERLSPDVLPSKRCPRMSAIRARWIRRCRDRAGRRQVNVKRVDECATLHDVFTHCLPAFGGAYLRRIYTILDHAIGMGCPLTVSIAGPVTVSGQHLAWLIPLIETGWVAYISTTDAVCYHDGHRSLDAHKHGPIHEVPIFTDDAALREDRTIRVTDMAFDEDVLLDQDRFLSAVLARPEFQKKMTGTELRYLLGEYYAAQEQQNGVAAAVCFRRAIAWRFRSSSARRRTAACS